MGSRGQDRGTELTLKAHKPGTKTSVCQCLPVAVTLGKAACRFQACLAPGCTKTSHIAHPETKRADTRPRVRLGLLLSLMCLLCWKGRESLSFCRGETTAQRRPAAHGMAEAPVQEGTRCPAHPGTHGAEPEHQRAVCTEDGPPRPQLKSTGQNVCSEFLAGHPVLAQRAAQPRQTGRAAGWGAPSIAARDIRGRVWMYCHSQVSPFGHQIWQDTVFPGPTHRLGQRPLWPGSALPPAQSAPSASQANPASSKGANWSPPEAAVPQARRRQAQSQPGEPSGIRPPWPADSLAGGESGLCRGQDRPSPYTAMLVQDLPSSPCPFSLERGCRGIPHMLALPHTKSTQPRCHVQPRARWDRTQQLPQCRTGQNAVSWSEGLSPSRARHLWCIAKP